MHKQCQQLVNEQWKGRPIVANLLSKNQPDPTVNESAIIVFY